MKNYTKLALFLGCVASSSSYGNIFGSIGDAFKSVGNTVAHAATHAAGLVTNNPVANLTKEALTDPGRMLKDAGNYVAHPGQGIAALGGAVAATALNPFHVAAQVGSDALQGAKGVGDAAGMGGIVDPLADTAQTAITMGDALSEAVPNAVGMGDPNYIPAGAEYLGGGDDGSNDFSDAPADPMAQANADAQATLGQLIQVYTQSGEQAAINAMNQVISMQNVDGTDGTHMMALIIVAASQNTNPQVLQVLLQLLMSEAVQDGNAKGVLKALQGYNPTVYQQAVTYIEAQVGGASQAQPQQPSYGSTQSYGGDTSYNNGYNSSSYGGNSAYSGYNNSNYGSGSMDNSFGQTAYQPQDIQSF